MVNGSYFKGWAGLGPTTSQPKATSGTGVDPLFGQVLEVYYRGSDNIGRIRVKVYNQSQGQDEKDVVTEAYPINKNIIKYPLPGELVMLSVSLTDSSANGYVAGKYYYTTVLSAASSVTYNSNPYFLNKESRSGITNIFAGNGERRFERKLQDTSRFLKKQIVIERPVLRPFEGDFIIQSRFGSSVRLGSTNINDKNPWSEFGGMAGSPITILSVNRAIISDVSTNKSIEDLDNNDSTIAVCSRQQIDVQIATSKKLKSYMYAYNVGI